MLLRCCNLFIRMKNMKKILFTLVVLTLMLLLVGCGNTKDGVTYELTENSDGYVVSDFTDTVAEVIIPSQFNGKPVVAIGDSAFMNSSNLEKLHCLTQ